MRTKIFAFFRETFRSLETIVYSVQIVQTITCQQSKPLPIFNNSSCILRFLSMFFILKKSDKALDDYSAALILQSWMQIQAKHVQTPPPNVQADNVQIENVQTNDSSPE